MDRYEEENGDDSDNETDPEQLLNEWLGELDNLTVGLDNVSSATLRPFNSDINTPRIDSYRFSMANLEDSQDVDLDAILGELCALERRCDNDLATSNAQRDARTKINSENSDMVKNEAGIRTDSPDNDSAFSDTVSMLSSESSASSSGSGHKSSQGAMHATQQQQSHQLMDAASRAKAEKIRLALEKIREASVQKLFIKAFTLDGSGKSLLVDEGMSVAHVCRLLADKNHVSMDPKWAVVEHLPDLFMERVYEDHELLVENLLLWTRDSKNKLLFVERADKTQLFLTPERFLLGPSDRGSSDYDDHSRNILLEEFFNNSNVGVPEVEGPLYLKSDSKKGWKRYHFILRASGLYYWPKEKARTARDLVCLATFDVNQVYYGIGWKKKYKAPTDFCFAIKHPRLQQAKSTKYIKFLCAEDSVSLERWMVGIRVAKYGRHLMDNYKSLVDELAQEDLDMLAHARCCSVSSITVSPPTQNNYTNHTNENSRQLGDTARLNGDTPTRQYDNPRQSYSSDGRLSRASSSSSSGCLSDGVNSNYEVAFECAEFPTGTIKRKPSMNPKLPLTSITRQLKEVGETVHDEPDAYPSPTSSGSSTLTRRHSRRRSGTADSDGSGTLKRHHRSANATPSSPITPGTPLKERTNSQNCSYRNDVHETKNLASPLQQQNCLIEPATLLPPPPPSPLRLSEEVELDAELLPPPPPEMFQSTLSLDSLPPPPGLDDLPLCSAPELNSSCLSLMSLPPPPSPLVVSDTGTVRRVKPKQSPPSESPPSLANLLVHSPPSDSAIFAEPIRVTPNMDTVRRSALKQTSHYATPPYLNELKNNSSPQAQRKVTIQEPSSPKKPIKKISFNLVSQEPGSPQLPVRKPAPPRRSDSTRLTSPKKLAVSDQAPPGDFLKDLQRVMRKKWQVAQKCALDTTTTPHEVLGFRDPPTTISDYRETNVSNWVQEHYGVVDNLYENVYRNDQGDYCGATLNGASLTPVKRRPPPPPPKRAETTQLTTRAAH